MATKKTTTKKSLVTSLEAPVYSQKGTNAGSIALPEKVFGLKWNANLVHDVVIAMTANARAGTAHTKDRSEVAGGGRKPWKQKGTGRARHGSTRSPIWVKGGTTFGPRNEKDYTKKINKKTRVKALYTLLSRQYQQGAVLFVDSLSLKTIKTKDAQAVVDALAKVDGFAGVSHKHHTSLLLVVPTSEVTIAKSFANIPGVTLIALADLNPLRAASYRHIAFVDPGATVTALEAKMK